jgi:hypothetical protein
MGGWMGGWMGGCKSRFKDCLQQSKTDLLLDISLDTIPSSLLFQLFI